MSVRGAYRGVPSRSSRAISFTDHGSCGTAKTVVVHPGESHHRLLLDSTTCVLTFVGAIRDQVSVVEIEMVQDTTGGRAVTWPSSVAWPNDLTPALSGAANARDRFRLVTRDGVTFDGSTIGVNFG